MVWIASPWAPIAIVPFPTVTDGNPWDHKLKQPFVLAPSTLTGAVGTEIVFLKKNQLMQLTKKEERNEGKGRKERQEEGPCCLLASTRSRSFFGLALLQLCFPALLCGSGHVQARATGWRPGLLSKCYVFFTKCTEVPLGKTLSSLEQTSSASCPVLTQLRPGSNTHPPSHTSV